MILIKSIENLFQSYSKNYKVNFPYIIKISKDIVKQNLEIQYDIISIILQKYYTSYSIISYIILYHFVKYCDLSKNMVNELFINSLIRINCFDHNIIKTLDLFIDFDFSILHLPTCSTILSIILTQVFMNDINNYKNTIDFIVSKNNFENEDDCINVRILFVMFYECKKYSEKYKCIDYYYHISDISYLLSTSNDVITDLKKYSRDNFIIFEEILEMKDYNNRPIIFYCCKYRNLSDLLNYKNYKKCLYKTYTYGKSMSVLYQILYNNIEEKYRQEFLYTYIGVIDTFDDIVVQINHNEDIKQEIKNHIVFYNNIYDYLL